MTGSEAVRVGGSDLALRFPTTAARLVVACHQGGGDVENAWSVLVSALGPEHASALVWEAAFTAGEDIRDLLLLQRLVGYVPRADEPLRVGGCAHASDA